MAKNFGKLNDNKIKAVAKKSSESANVITVKMIGNNDLLDYPKNNEDVSMTEDLELSMKQNGFTDPIEVTTFGCDDGKYMIVSGHRRRVAGCKVGITTFPCIIKNFKSDTEVCNYVLLANSQRDSAKDPLLFCKRYKMHEEYLKESNFEGSVREEIAKRLGLSVQHADRYNQMNKVILPVWDMVREEKVGMSSVLPMSKFLPEHQEEIVSMFEEFMETGQRLSRDVCKMLIEGYKAGKKSCKEIMTDEHEPLKTSFSKGVYINTEPEVTKEEEPKNRNDEVNYDTSHREGLETNRDKFEDEKPTDDDMATIDLISKQEKAKKPLTDIEKKLKIANDIENLLARLENMLGEHYCYSCNEQAMSAMRKMTDSIHLLVDGMYYISLQYEDKKVENTFNTLLNNILKDLKGYMSEE